MGKTESDTTESREPVIAQIVELQRKMLRAIHAATAPAWLQLDVTMAQLKGLTILADLGPLTVTSLGHALGIGAPAASHLVERLVQLDLAARHDDPNDRRRTIVTLTDQGNVMVERLRHDGVEHLRQWVAYVPDPDLLKLRDGLEALVSATRLVSPVVNDRQLSGDASGEHAAVAGAALRESGKPAHQ